MMIFHKRIFLSIYSMSVLFICCLGVFTVEGSGTTTADLINKATREGAVHVIVKLKVANIESLKADSMQYKTVTPGLEGVWNGFQADMALRDNILLTSHQVLSDLMGEEYQLNRVYQSIPYMSMTVSARALTLLEKSKLVSNIEEDVPFPLIYPESGNDQSTKGGNLSEDGTDPPLLNNTTTLIGASDTWDMGYTGNGWYVAVLDTGIRSSHEFFAGKTIVEACYSKGQDGTVPAGDCPNGNATMTGAGSAVHHPDTYYGWDHGTHVAGIASGDNGALKGVAPDANIIAVQVFSKFDAASCGGSPCVLTWNSDVLAGLDYIYSIRGSYSIAAVNLSLGGGQYTVACDTDSRKTAIDNLRGVGIATAIATGNEGYCGAVGAPACISSSVAVGSSTDADAESSFNNWHATMQKLFAPGSSIYSSTGDSNTSYESWNGTSMATPHVTGAWALMKQFKSEGTVSEFLTALQSTGPGITSVCDGYVSSIPRILIDEAISSMNTLEITVLSPNGGENWDSGSSQNITWNSQGMTNELVRIQLYRNNVKVGNIASNVDVSLGTYSWTVGDYIGGVAPAGSGYAIRIRVQETTLNDSSDTPFSITDVTPQIAVLFPNGGENWGSGSSQNITWNSQGMTNELVRIQLYRNNVKVGNIASNVDVTLGTYSWTVGNYVGGVAPAGSGYAIRIRVQGTTLNDSSDSSFSITDVAPQITVLSPNGGENWDSGSSQNITWNSQGMTNELVRIQLYRNNVKVGNIASNVDVSLGTYSWTVGDYIGGVAPAGSGYAIRIRVQETTFNDFSDSSFAISNP